MIFITKRAHLIKYFALPIAILVSTSICFAEENLPVKVDKLPFKVQPNGENLPDIVFDDGRVAEVVVRQHLGEFSVTMDIAQNSCGKNIPTTCRIVHPYLDYKLQLVWKVHPNPEKIGKLLKRDNSDIFDQREVISYTGKIKHPDILKDIKNPEMTCSTWDWLAPNSQQIDLLDWSIEVMLPNPETLLNENRTFRSYQNMTLTKINQTTYSLGLPKTDELDAVLIIGDQVGWTVKKENFESCEVTIKPDIASVVSDFQKEKNYSAPISISPNSPFWEAYAKGDFNYKVKAMWVLAKKHPDLLFFTALRLVSGTPYLETGAVAQVYKVSASTGDIQ